MDKARGGGRRAERGQDEGKSRDSSRARPRVVSRHSTRGVPCTNTRSVARASVGACAVRVLVCPCQRFPGRGQTYTDSGSVPALFLNLAIAVAASAQTGRPGTSRGRECACWQVSTLLLYCSHARTLDMAQ